MATLAARLKQYSLRRYRKLLLPVFIMSVAVGGAAYVCNVNLNTFTAGIVKGLNFLTYMFPPDWSAFPDMIMPALESIILAFMGTVLGTILSLCFALAASRNIAHKWVRNTSRFLIGAERSLPEIIILLILIAALGLGSFPAVIALSLGCIGMLGKLFADTIEEIDNATLESIEATGASKFQVIAFGVLPEVMPSIIANAVFRFEINIRLSVVLGAVGAGGIGFELYHSFAVLEYQRACTALIVVLTMVFITERFSDRLRRKMKKVEQLR